jgi:hypothetical protein
VSYGADRTVVAVTILSGQSLSSAVAIGARRIVGIQMPAGWDAAGITFAALTRQSSGNPVVPTFGKVQDAGGTEVAITAPALDTYIALPDTAALGGLGQVKLRSGTAGAPVNQTADRVLGLVLVDR